VVRQVGAVQELPRTAGIYQAELSLRLHGNFSSSLSLLMPGECSSITLSEKRVQ